MLSDEHAYMRAQIKETLSQRETDDLLEIWWEADHEEWTDLAFEVVKELLLERLGEIPAQAAEEPVAAVEPEPEIPVVVATAGEIKKFVRQQTYEAMDELETDELIEIWLEADHDEWTELAFEAVQQILMERIGEVPAREEEEPEAEDESEAETEPEPAETVVVDASEAGARADAEDQTQGFELPFGLSSMHCPDCGKEISEEDKVCPHCGVDLEAPLDEAQLQELAAEYIEKAENYYDQGRDFKAALANCDLALEYVPNSAQVHNLRGLILDALGKTALAVQEYKEAARLDPGLSDARENLTDAETELKSRRNQAED